MTVDENYHLITNQWENETVADLRKDQFLEESWWITGFIAVREGEGEEEEAAALL